MTRKDRTILKIALLVCALPSFCQASQGAIVSTYTVTVNTSPLVGHPAGPFSIVLAFTDGSGLGDANNAITLTNVDFGGGSGSGGIGISSGASGSLETGVVITDSSPVSYFSETFLPGQSLKFTVTLTATDEPGDQPDGLSFYILDSSGQPIPTQSPAADFLFAIDLRASGDTSRSFGTDPARSPANGNPIAMEAPIVMLQDTFPPVSTASLFPQPNPAGWNNSNVTVTLNSTDNESGGTGVKQITYSATGAQPIASTAIPGATTSLTISTEGITIITFYATDNAGNIETAKTITIKLDKTPPTISGTRMPSANANGWNNTDVSVSFSCSDSLSGLMPGSLPATTVVAAEGANQSVTGTCMDLAGNFATATVQGINIDKTAPTVSCSASPAVLWPPNHELVPINVIVVISDSLSGPAGFTLNSVTSNEPDSGQGDIQGFVIGTASTNGQLRAERLGSGDGRFYTIGYTGIDRAGNPTTCNTNVSVPHDQGH